MGFENLNSCFNGRDGFIILQLKKKNIVSRHETSMYLSWIAERRWRVFISELYFQILNW